MTTLSVNRQWVLARSPQGQVRVDDFARRDTPLPVPDLAAGEILIRAVMLGFDPAQRDQMDDGVSHMPSMAIGEPVRGSAAARVITLANPAYPEGAVVRGLFSWQDYAVAAREGEAAPVVLPPDVTLEEALGVLGGASLTAHVGLNQVGRLRAGGILGTISVWGRDYCLATQGTAVLSVQRYLSPLRLVNLPAPRV